MHLINPVSVLGLLVAALPAQSQKLKARNFFFDGYTTVFCIDMKKVRDVGVWDDFCVGPAKMALNLTEKMGGYKFEELERVTMVRKAAVAGDGSDGDGYEVVAIESSGVIGDLWNEFGEWSAVEVADYTLMVNEWEGHGAYVRVTPNLRVSGPTEVLETVLGGELRSGLPSGEVMSLTAGQKGLLAYGVIDLRDGALLREVKENILPDADWPSDDPLALVCIRLLMRGDEDDPHVSLEVVLRHRKDGAGLVASEAAVTLALQKLRARKEARMFLPLLKKVQRSRDATDAVWRLDLGRARVAAGMLSTLALTVPVLLASNEVVEVKAAPPAAKQVLLEEEVEPPPPPPPESGNGGGGN